MYFFVHFERTSHCLIPTTTTNPISRKKEQLSEPDQRRKEDDQLGHLPHERILRLILRLRSPSRLLIFWLHLHSELFHQLYEIFLRWILENYLSSYFKSCCSSLPTIFLKRDVRTMLLFFMKMIFPPRFLETITRMALDFIAHVGYTPIWCSCDGNIPCCHPCRCNALRHSKPKNHQPKDDS
jgi:hypothetical protein